MMRTLFLGSSIIAGLLLTNVLLNSHQRSKHTGDFGKTTAQVAAPAVADDTVWNKWADQRRAFLRDELDLSDSDIDLLDQTSQTTGSQIQEIVRKIEATPPQMDDTAFQVDLKRLKQEQGRKVLALLGNKRLKVAQKFQDSFNEQVKVQFGIRTRIVEF